MHEWMSDCGYTPHIVVDANAADVDVPGQYIQDGRIILNVSYSAAHNLDLGNDIVSFEARFSGTPFRVSVPMHAVLGIYARETGQGMVFSEPDSTGQQSDEAVAAIDVSDDDKPAGQGRPNLRVIK